MKLTIDIPDHIEGLTLSLLGIVPYEDGTSAEFTLYSQNYANFSDGDTLKYTGEIVGVPSSEDTAIIRKETKETQET